jgi:hypothetical protein
MKSSFNAYGKTRDEFGNLTIPVWLGKAVERVPVGGTLDRAYLKAGVLYQAGCPINITDKVIKPFVVMEVTAVESGKVTVNVGGYGIVPETSDYIQKAAAKLAAASAITAVEAGANAGEYVLTTAASVAVGDAVVLSPSSAGATLPNAYLFNDIYIGKDYDVASEETAATGAAVMYNPAGILIDRTPAGLIKDIMKSAVPGVYQHNE